MAVPSDWTSPVGIYHRPERLPDSLGRYLECDAGGFFWGLLVVVYSVLSVAWCMYPLFNFGSVIQSFIKVGSLQLRLNMKPKNKIIT